MGAHHDDLRSRAHLLPPHRSAPLLLLIIIMGIWDAFTGKKSAAQSSSSDTTLQDSAPGLTFNNTTPSSDDVGSFMSQPGAFDPSSLHPLAGLNQDTLDYLTLDDTALSDLPGSPEHWWRMGSCRRSEQATCDSTSEAPTEQRIKRNHKKRTVLGQLSRCGGYDVQRYQQHNRLLPGQARLAQQRDRGYN